MRNAMFASALAAAALALAPTALADQAPAGTVTFSPNATGAPSHLLFDAKGQPAGWNKEELPGAMTVSFQQGFSWDALAAKAVCSSDAAKNYKCPAASQIAKGTVDVLATGTGFSPGGDNYTAEVDLYNAAAQQPGDLAGVVFYFRETSSNFQGSSIGRLAPVSGDPTFGSELRFDKLPLPSLPPSFHFTIKRFRLDVGAMIGPGFPAAKPKPKHKKKKKKKHRKRHCTKKHPCKKKHHSSRRSSAAQADQNHSYITNPATCTGEWKLKLAIAYPSGTRTLDMAAPCTTA